MTEPGDADEAPSVGPWRRSTLVREHAPYLLALLALVAIASLYFWRLDAWLVNDDEGSYLYAAWRISLGELPYRDFLTPQLPAFLLPGGVLMRMVGPHVFPARALAALLTLGAGAAVWATARRLFGPWVALVAGALLLLHPDVYLECRTYRPEPFMLFFAAVGIYLFSRGVLGAADATRTAGAGRSTVATRTVGTAAAGATSRTVPTSAAAPSGSDEPAVSTDASGASKTTGTTSSRRWWLAASGVFFGLASLSKLFGVLPLAACGAWLVVASLRRRRTYKELLEDTAAIGVTWGLVVAVGIGVFALATTEVYEAVLGHHLRQGAQLSSAQVVKKGLSFYATYVRYNSNALLMFVAIAVAAFGWRERDRRTELFAWHLPTLALFLVLSRELWPRHLIYVLPAAVTLYSVGVHRLTEGLDGRLPRQDPDEPTAGEPNTLPASSRAYGSGVDHRAATARSAGSNVRQWLALALVIALLVPWALVDRDSGWRWEDGTWRLADLISGLTAPGEVVLSDYSELNFYSLRPTTYSGASLSAGAAGSGQITWERMSGELAAMGQEPQLVVVDRTQYAGQEYGHLRFLHDLSDFEDWLAAGYYLAGAFRRDPQRYLVYVPKDRPLPVNARYVGGPTLVAASASAGKLRPGDSLELVTLWRAEDTPEELVTTIRLVDLGGREWAQADEALRGSQRRPTSQWEAGELTSDRLSLEIPPGTPPGEYEARLGLYRRDDLARLEAEGPDGAALGQGVSVGVVEVAPPAAGRRVSDPLEIATRLDLEAGGLELLGRGKLPDSLVEAGTLMPIDLYWRAQGGADLPLVRLLLVGAGEMSSPEHVVAGETMRALGVPGSPPSSWPDQQFAVRQRLRVPVHASAPDGVYDLMLELVGQDGTSLDSQLPETVLGQVTVAGRDLSELVLEPPPHEIELDATIDYVARLVGADVSGLVSPGGKLAVELVWRAIAPTGVPYKVSVQLVDGSGAIVAQHDAEPADWSRPTTGWLPDEIVVDRHSLELPDDFVVGSYSLLVRMYDPFTLKALPVSGADAAGDAVQVTTVELSDS